MNASSTGLSGLGRTKSLVLAALVAAFGMLALAGTSKAAPVTHTITVDNGKLTLGAVFPDNTIIPADVPGPLPFPPYANAGPSGTIDVDVDGTTATVAAGDFKMPTVWVPKPGEPDTHVPVLMSVPNGLTGTTSAEGDLDLTGDLRISVITGTNAPVPPSPLPTPQVCQIDAPNVTWSTGLNAVTPGVPFAAGLEGDGAISAAWADLPNGTEVDGGDCSTVNAVIHDTGAIWLSSGIDTPPDPPVCEPPSEGLWPDCVTPPTPKVKITAVKIQPAKKTIKAGKKLNLKIKVTNKGDKAGKVTVKLNVNKKKGVKLAKKVVVNVGAGKTATKSVPFKTTRKAKGKYKVTAKGAGKTGKSTITVKPAKKKKK